MAAATQTRPSLLRPSMFAVAWNLCTWLGLAIVVVSAFNVGTGALLAMAEPLVMVAVIVGFSELRPIVMTRLVGNPVSISLAFVFAAMYLWGLYPAVLILTFSTVFSEILQRKPLWKLLFNAGQYTCSLAAAWLVMLLAGVRPAPDNPHTDFSAADLWWIVGTWVVYHLVNLALVAGLADDVSWWEDFSDEFWFYTTSTVAVLALSPLIAIVATAYPYSWTMLPLLLLPLLAVQKAAEMSRQQEHQALHDPLTGLPNRLLLTDRIDQALARSRRSGARIVVMFLDLDLFKIVNDSLGHHAGDAMLIEVAQRLQSRMAPGDTLARFGGDEFVVVCETTPDGDVEWLATALTNALRQPFTSGGSPVSVTASIGVALAHEASDSQTLLRDADAAMYRAKERGRDQVAMFHDVMHQEAEGRLADSMGLRRALAENEFRLVYQPVVELTSGRMVGMEALIRWQDPDRGLLDPGHFIPAAEETGLIVPIGQWVLTTALSHMAQWRSGFADDLWIAVNISSRELLSPGLVDEVSAALSAAGVPPAALHLEITESALMSDLESVVRTLADLRALGLGLAVDDFGTGYSSLAYLKGLPVTALKIDRSFVSGLGGPDDGYDRPIVDAIVKMAQSLQLEVIAEGVETHAQLDVLEQLGVPVGQGYLWARPLQAERVPKWITTRTRSGRPSHP